MLAISLHLPVVQKCIIAIAIKGRQEGTEPHGGRQLGIVLKSGRNRKVWFVPEGGREARPKL